MDLTILYLMIPLGSGRSLTREDEHLKTDSSAQDGPVLGKSLLWEGREPGS